MRNPDEFDAFYKDARSRLLLQTYALTGDLTASRSAVRDSFVVAWHQWRKVSRLEDPESWVRPHAWAHAQRRHTARLWHRDRGLDPEVKATLDALGKLGMTQRRTLLLSALTTLSLPELAREVGLPLADAERELQTATAQLALHRDVPSTSIRPLFEPVREHVEASAAWPRATIIRRAGAARRRTHTAIGAVAAVAALVVTGSLVTDDAGVHPTLAREHAATATGRPAAQVEAPEVALPDDALLSAAQVASDVPGRHWRETGTDDNTDGDGLVLPCQQARYADPKGTAALFRTFASKPGRQQDKASTSTATQVTEVSATPRAARRAWSTTLDWYAGCRDDRVQLLSTRRVGDVGDQAMLLVLRDWNRPAATLVVGVARSGLLTTTTMSRVGGTGSPDLGRAARLLAAAVGGLCGLPDGGACAGTPHLRVVPPLPVGQVPAMLSEVDLPPVATVDRPWVGTEPRKALTNVAATGCDRADFSAPPVSHNLTRTFLIPKARVADQFGLTETVGSFPVARARAFVAGVRSRLAACPDKDLGTKVARIAQVAGPRQDLSVWHVTTEISDQSSVDYYMGIVRTGTSVAQVGFVPSGRVAMAPGTFVDLVHRALDRLAALPAPRR